MFRTVLRLVGRSYRQRRPSASSTLLSILPYLTLSNQQVSEWEAAWRLTEFRRRAKNYRGLAYENISATGPNAALPHYSPLKSDCLLIDTETPYLNDSGGQYLDGTCDTTRTVHLGRPSEEMCEAFTRVLQGHVRSSLSIRSHLLLLLPSILLMPCDGTDRDRYGRVSHQDDRTTIGRARATQVMAGWIELFTWDRTRVRELFERP